MHKPLASGAPVAAKWSRRATCRQTLPRRGVQVSRRAACRRGPHSRRRTGVAPGSCRGALAGRWLARATGVTPAAFPRPSGAAAPRPVSGDAFRAAQAGFRARVAHSTFRSGFAAAPRVPRARQTIRQGCRGSSPGIHTGDPPLAREIESGIHGRGELLLRGAGRGAGRVRRRDPRRVAPFVRAVAPGQTEVGAGVSDQGARPGQVPGDPGGLQRAVRPCQEDLVRQGAAPADADRCCPRRRQG